MIGGHVELVGAPGSGKSTLARRLSGRRSGRGPNDSVAERAGYLVPADRLLLRPRTGAAVVGPVLSRPWSVAACARYPRLGSLVLGLPEPHRSRGLDAAVADRMERVAELIAGVALSGPRAREEYRKEALAWMEGSLAILEGAQHHPAVRASHSHVVPLLEEGVVQRSLSLLGATATASQWASLQALLPQPGALVHLRAEPRLLEERAVRRLRDGTAPVLHRGLTVGEAVQLVLEDAHALERAVQALAASGARVLTVQVDRHDSVARLSAEVRRWLGALSSTGAAT